MQSSLDAECIVFSCHCKTTTFCFSTPEPLQWSQVIFEITLHFLATSCTQPRQTGHLAPTGVSTEHILLPLQNVHILLYITRAPSMITSHPECLQGGAAVASLLQQWRRRPRLFHKYWHTVASKILASLTIIAIVNQLNIKFWWILIPTKHCWVTDP